MPTRIDETEGAPAPSPFEPLGTYPREKTVTAPFDTDADGNLRIETRNERGTTCVAVLSDAEAWELVVYLTDGLCPVCGDEIPLNRVVCEGCTRKAMSRWGIREAPDAH